MNLTEIQNNLASSDPHVVIDAEQALIAVAQDTFPDLSTLDNDGLDSAYDIALSTRDAYLTKDPSGSRIERYWLRVWYIQQLMKGRGCAWSDPPSATPLGRLLTFLADEVNKWTGEGSRHSPEVIDALTEVVTQLRRHEAGESIDLKRVEQAAVTVCVGLELLTGDETVLVRFGRALKAVKQAYAGLQ